MISRNLAAAACLVFFSAAPVAGALAQSGSPIRIVGSSTVYPFTTAVAEQFKQRFPQYPAPIVESLGTGGGLKLFCEAKGANAPQIANASRRIKQSEILNCSKNGINKIVEIQVGLDGVALAQARNAGAISLTERDIYAALAATPFGKPQTAKTWKDVNPKLPAMPIEVIGPPPTSGTRDAFAELILEKGCEKDPAMKALKSSNEQAFKKICTSVREDGAYVEAGENDNLIVQKLVANPRAIGVFGYSFLESNLDKVKGVPVEGVPPSYETISSFKYPAARAMYIYVNPDRAATKPGMKEFLRAYTSEAAWGPKGYLAKRGLIPSPTATRAKYAQAAANMTPLDPKTVK